MPTRGSRRGNGSSTTRSSSSASSGHSSLARIISELRATAVRARNFPEDPTVTPFSAGQFQTLSNHLRNHLVEFDPFERVSTYLTRADVFQTDVYNAVHTLINGIHEQRGMNLETLDYLMEVIDIWSNRPAGEFSWEFSRRLCFFLLRLDPSSANPVRFQFSLSIPLAAMFMEFLRADYPNPAPAPPSPPPRYSGDRRIVIVEQPWTFSPESETPGPPYSPGKVADLLLPDIPRRQLTTAILNEHTKDSDTKQVTCVICTERIGLRNMMTRLPCGHMFHTPCIAHVFYYRDYGGESRPCPCCRYECGPVPDWEEIADARKRSRELDLDYLGEELGEPLTKRTRRA
ncbi:uncharacterized protein N7496_008834 [Penicillium cataractarum]|uniref:RING-type domain-containing protein n=1 Tax=Penicillium cataractarum TaxID=2100454 RepID=A0A9W9S117_9EURO|nr:uncharacterized protein N7496_008834 [Penicillium cataractarum]KAJ5369074.1 hypothetical protein N7496_008834 [Penicillium cataractarum]